VTPLKEITMTALKYPDFKGPAKPIEDLDLPRIGAEIGVGEDEVHMLIVVEAAGSGFDSAGRPKMLFEPHIFWRELGPGKARDTAAKQGLAYPKWKRGYPKDSYPRLAKAMAIDEAAALRSASWGASQVLGVNFKAAGFASVQDMVNAMCEDEEHHIEAMIGFCKSNGIDDDLRRLAELKRATTPADCAPIARVYNGSGYAANNYHVKMADAHNKWRKIPDTAWTPDMTAGPILVPPAPGVTQDQEGLSVADVRAIQQLLKDKGYVEVGNVDGDIGKATVSAVSAFQITQGLPVTGKVDRALWEQLKAAPMRPVSVERANASTAEVTQNAAPPIADTVKQQSMLKNIMIGIGTVSGLGTILDGGVPDLDKLAGTINKTQLILNTIGDKLPWVIGLGAAGVGMYVASGALSKLKDGFRKGTIR
jgi:peptidoglycan hydrolase-like protein with peptidoglycan-binding domain